MTDTQQVTLASWLLACIAEDQAAEQARLWDEYGCRLSRNSVASPQYTVHCWACGWADEAEFGSGAQELWKAHVLADHASHALAVCAAHRAIVELALNREWHGSYAVRDVFLEALGSAYADRPGFREEWG